MSLLVDLVKIFSVSTGSGAIVLGEAVSGYRGVEALTDGSVYSYSIQQEGDWEVGRGTYLAGQKTFVRSVLLSSTGGTPINLQPNASIAFVALAEDIYELAGNVPVDYDALAAEIARASAVESFLAQRISVAAAGIQIVPTIVERDAFYAIEANRGKLIYVNNNNGSGTDPANGVYEYVGGSARIAQSFYEALATIVQPLVDEAKGYRDEAAELVANSGNFWRVSPYSEALSRPLVDTVNGVVKYGRLLLQREGADFMFVTPADYGLTTFDLPFATIAGPVYFHYVDVEALTAGTGNPVKSLTTSVKAESTKVAPLGMSYFNNYVCTFAEPLWSNRVDPGPLMVESNSGAVLFDRDGTYGTPNAFYFPLGARFVRANTDTILGAITNPQNGDLPGYCSLLKSASAAQTLLWTETTGALEIVGFSAVEAAMAVAPGKVHLLATWWGPTITTNIQFEALGETPAMSTAQTVQGARYFGAGRASLQKAEAGEGICHILIGPADSYSQLKYAWVTPFTRRMKTLYGDAGPGWTGLGLIGADPVGNADPAEMATARTGTWTDVSAIFGAPDTPGLSSTQSSTAGSRQTLTYAGGKTLAVVRLHYVGGGSGVVRYRWNGGAWTTLNLTGSGAQNTALIGAPAGNFTLDIEVISGTCTLAGVFCRSTGPGVMFSTLAQSGSSLTQEWVGLETAGPDVITDRLARHAAALASLETKPTIFHALIGTNDQRLNKSPAAYGVAMGRYINEVHRVANPKAGILWAMPPENGKGYSTPMSQYVDVGRGVASNEKVMFASLQDEFGQTYADYDDLFEADDLHPNVEGGRREQVVFTRAYRFVV